MGGLNPGPTPTFELELPPLEVPELATALPPGPEATLPALATAFAGGEAPEDIPVLDQAENLFGSETAVSYETTVPFDDVVTFYKEQMPANGWEEAEGSFSFGEVSILNYVKEGRSAIVTITKAGEKTTVLVGIAPG
jgi:hypothetical protein